jgi:hypothetical protein
LIFSAGAQNVAHAWQLGAAHSEFRAIVLAVAAGGATLLAALGFAAAGVAFRKWRFGRALTALGLGLGALLYSGANSLGFVHGSRDLAISERSAVAGAGADRRAIFQAALAEYGTLKGQTIAVLKRRRELQGVMRENATRADGRAVGAVDPQAQAIGYYLRAAGYSVDDASVGVWLSAAVVAFLETGAALSLTVAHALTPTRGSPPARATAPAAPAPMPPMPETEPARVEPRQPRQEVSEGKADGGDNRDQDPPAPPPPPARPRPKGKPGRPAAVLATDAVDRIRAKGGALAGNLNDIGRAIGSGSKTATHRLLHRMASAGRVHLTTTPAGVRVVLA